MTRSARRWAVAAVLVAVALIVGALLAAPGGLGYARDTGYLAALFAPDGRSVYAIRRETAAWVSGFGREFFTAPATVRMRRDRFAIVNISLADGRTTVVESFPATPLEGSTIRSYHGAIFGSAHGHLRWTGTHLDYEIGVTRHDEPQSRTFVTRRMWNEQSGAWTTTSAWTEGSTGWGGDEPQQLAGDRELIALPGDEGTACALVVMGAHDTAGRALVETPACRTKYHDGYSAAVLTPYSRRADIERSDRVRRTFADLVERGRRSGVPEAQAMLDADDEMSRRGLYPKPTTIVAQRRDCEVTPIFAIADEQFTVGLFPDIERAVASPGQPVNKSLGDYITHRDYTTSQEINAYLAAGHDHFVVRARGACWEMRIQR